MEDSLLRDGQDDKLKQLSDQVAAARRRQDTLALAHSLLQLGQAYLEDGNAPRALTQFEEGLTLTEALEDPTLAAQLWGHKGLALVAIGNLDFALHAFRQSQRWAKSADQAELQCDALLQIGTLQVEMGKATQAIATLERALHAAGQSGDAERKMHVASRLGTIFLRLESPEKAAEYLEQALALAQQAADVAALQLDMGRALLGYGDEEASLAAEGYFDKALEQAVALEDPALEARALGLLMEAAMAAGLLSKVLLYGDRALAQARTAGHSKQELVLIEGLAAWLIQQDRATRALPYLQRGLELAEEWPDQFRMQDGLGLAYYELADYASAREHYQQALELADLIQDDGLRARTFGHLGVVQAELGQLPAAVEAARKALALAKAVQLPPLVGQQQMMLAFAYRDLGQWEQALAACRAGLATYASLGDEAMVARAQQLLAELEDAAG